MQRNRVSLLVLCLFLVGWPWGRAASASPQDDPQDSVEFRLWAGYLNVLRNAEVLETTEVPKPPKSVEQFLSEARSKHGFTPEQVGALVEKGEALGWESSSECATPAEPVHPNGLVTAPFQLTSVSTPPQTSPPQQLRRVIIEVVVTSAGELVRPKILMGVEGHDAEALATVQARRWSPALLCGKPVDCFANAVVELRTDSQYYMGGRAPGTSPNQFP